MQIDSGNEIKDGDEFLTRWEHISSNTSKDYYHVYQDWHWSTETKPLEFFSKRNYSFLGVYRKFCEADIFEVMRLKKLVREQMAIKQIEEQILFCDFNSNSSLTVFFKDFPIL